MDFEEIRIGIGAEYRPMIGSLKPTEYLDISSKVLTKEMLMCNIYYFVMNNVNLKKNMSNVKIKRLKTYIQKDLITRNNHVKYVNSGTQC